MGMCASKLLFRLMPLLIIRKLLSPENENFISTDFLKNTYQNVSVIFLYWVPLTVYFMKMSRFPATTCNYLRNKFFLEASHKEFRKHRFAHTRKSSRINTNKDLLNLLLLRSDPLISQSRNPVSKKSKTRDTDIQSYIITESDNSCSSSDLTCPAIKIECDNEMSS